MKGPETGDHNVRIQKQRELGEDGKHLTRLELLFRLHFLPLYIPPQLAFDILFGQTGSSSMVLKLLDIRVARVSAIRVEIGKRVLGKEVFTFLDASA